MEFCVSYLENLVQDHLYFETIIQVKTALQTALHDGYKGGLACPKGQNSLSLQ